MTGLAEFRQAPAFARYVAVVAALAVNRSQPQAEAPTARQAAARGRVRGAVPIKDLLTPLFADPDTVLTLKQVRALFPAVTANTLATALARMTDLRILAGDGWRGYSRGPGYPL